MLDGSKAQLSQQLQNDQLIADDSGVMRTTRRWQAAMARAVYRLLCQGETREDLRIPMALALLDLYPELSDETLVILIEILLPLELRALNPRG